jgi:hypothetical protein
MMSLPACFVLDRQLSAPVSSPFLWWKNSSSSDLVQPFLSRPYRFEVEQIWTTTDNHDQWVITRTADYIL